MEKETIKEKLTKNKMRDGMVTRIFCTSCEKERQLPSAGLSEIVNIQSDKSVKCSHEKGDMDWKNKAIITNQCFDLGIGGRIYPLHYCKKNKNGGIRIKII